MLFFLIVEGGLLKGTRARGVDDAEEGAKKGDDTELPDSDSVAAEYLSRTVGWEIDTSEESNLYCCRI
jgi:hypothetical protein